MTRYGLTDKRQILLVDMNSFYASVEQAQNPGWRGKPVVICGDPERRSGIVLAASREAKAFGIKTVDPVWEVRQKCPQAILVRPRMETYVEVSLRIMEIAKRFTPQVEVFSIDELFLDVTGTEKLWGGPWEVARKFRELVREETGVVCSVGISYNKLAAKVCCDTMAKKAPEGIHEWKAEDIEREMHPLPVRELFGVGSRMEKHFHSRGLVTIGDLANYPLHLLKKRFGVMGEVFHLSANGIDYSPVTPNTFAKDMKGCGHMMTLPRDYESAQEVEVVILELAEEVGRRLRRMQKRGRTINIMCGYKGFMGGFSRQFTMSEATNLTRDLYEAARKLFHQHWNGSPVRSIGVSIDNLVDDTVQQLDLFRDWERERRLAYTLDNLQDRFGKTAVLRATSLTAAGQALQRAGKIGGHYK
ncbi:DNA polymerase IV [Tumebacillus permanentifrigoris]|uniref:DNA polymerase IV n=1 Tax=Tumebacillus permanentifrigoris TaxID=378543 RepID=A0A316D3T5_9BACL|nr:DNA polymerase IV [Tumebacillus permanentifrigoris]PWK06606.1 DNA polymerase-4 [Tumebacillus permanentifrigoris]